MTTAIMYHGGSDTRSKGYLWVTEDLDYAESYGQVTEVEVADDLRILDLSSVACDHETDMDVDAMQDLLDDAGIDFAVAAARLSIPEPQTVAYAVAALARAAGFAGIRVREWTYGVGRTTSTMLLV